VRPAIIATALVTGVFGIPVPAASSDTIPVTIFDDGFESGDLSRWDNVATNRYAVTSNPSHVHTGDYALEGTIADDGWGGEINKWFLPGYDEIYVRFNVMFEPGFQNLRGDGNGMHFASVAGNRIDDKWSSHGQAGITPDGTDFFVTTVDPDHSWGDPTLEPFTFYSYFPDMVPPWGNVFRQDAPAAPIEEGRWHEIIIHVDAGTPGQYDGSQSLWIDGVEKIEVTGMRWRDSTDLRLNEFAIVDYMPGTPQTQHIWFDNVWVGTAFPGSAGPDLHATVGLVDPATGQWHLRAPNGASSTFYYGHPGDVPFLGDWDCDGDETPGLFRRADGYVYLRNSTSQGIADLEFFFGNPGDVPLAGDFDGDGCDTVSIYRPSEARIYVINHLGDGSDGLGAADYFYDFGIPGDQPFVADFDADHVDTVGLHRASTGLVYYRNENSTGIAHAQFVYGDPDDRIFAADWNGNGVESVGVFRPSRSRMYLRFTNSQGNANVDLPWGDPDWLPVAGS
jgi:Polysaccharide lyase